MFIFSITVFIFTLVLNIYRLYFFIRRKIKSFGFSLLPTTIYVDFFLLVIHIQVG